MLAAPRMPIRKTGEADLGDAGGAPEARRERRARVRNEGIELGTGLGSNLGSNLGILVGVPNNSGVGTPSAALGERHFRVPPGFHGGAARAY